MLFWRAIIQMMVEIQIVISTPGTGLKEVKEYLFLKQKYWSLKWIILGQGTTPVPVAIVLVPQLRQMQQRWYFWQNQLQVVEALKSSSVPLWATGLRKLLKHFSAFVMWSLYIYFLIASENDIGLIIGCAFGGLVFIIVVFGISIVTIRR